MDEFEATSPQPTQSSSFVRRGAGLGVLLALIGFAYFGGYQKGKAGQFFATEVPVTLQDAVFQNTQNPDATIDFSLYWRVWDLLKERYVDRDGLDAKILFYGAIDGMLAASGDPYTTFFSPKEQREFQEDISGSFEGIGAEMTLKDNILTIVAPLDESPAQKAGLMPNDRVLKINDETTVDLNIDEAVSKIRGPRGTEVKLSIYREGEDEAREISIRRDIIVVKSVKFEIQDGIGIIRVSRFGEDTAEDFDKAITSIALERPQGLILDLRNNPGGYLDAAVDIAHHFLESGTAVVLEENAEGKRRTLSAEGNPRFLNLPIAVLINEGSASASEILAAALQERHAQTTLIGKKSFGKGSVQELIPVGKDTSVKITVARWLTPDGNQINHVGISPDVEVSITREDIDAKRDPQMGKAKEILSGTKDTN